MSLKSIIVKFDLKINRYKYPVNSFNKITRITELTTHIPEYNPSQ